MIEWKVFLDRNYWGNDHEVVEGSGKKDNKKKERASVKRSGISLKWQSNT